MAHSSLVSVVNANRISVLDVLHFVFAAKIPTPLSTRPGEKGRAQWFRLRCHRR
jgi:hypothetical protein